MAMTGGTAYLVKSERTNYGSNNWTTDLYIYVKVISQNVIANTSTIALGMYVYSQYSIAWSDFGTNGTSYIGTATSGTNCFTFTNGQSGSGTKWLVEDKQVTVSHNSNGTLTIPIYWHWGVNSPWGQYTGPSGSYNVTLSTIDRVAPTVTFSVSGITASGFKISANSTAITDIWQYSINGGSTWTTFSTAASTSASVTLSSLSPNTNYTVKVRARRQYNQVYGTSGSSTVKTLGGAVVNSVSTVTADNASVTITLNVTVYEPSYLNSLAIKSGNTTILTVTGLAWTKGTASRSVTLTSAQRTTLLNWMASIKSFTGTFAVSSFSGSTQIGGVSSRTAVVQTTAANSAPTLSDFTYARMGDLAEKVTAQLGGETKPTEPAKPTTSAVKAGDLVTITGSTYYNGKAIPGWVKKPRWYVVEVSGDRAVINKDESGRYAIMSPIKVSALSIVGAKPAENYRIHTVVHGDTLWVIAKKYLGNGNRYNEIVSLNGLTSNIIYSGMKLKIPNK